MTQAAVYGKQFPRLLTRFEKRDSRKVLVGMKTSPGFVRWCGFSLLLITGLFMSGCGGGGERAAEKEPDPGIDASAGTTIPPTTPNSKK